MKPGGLWWNNVLNSDLLPQRHRPDTRPECQDPVSHMALKKREKKGKKKEKIKENKIKLLKLKKFIKRKKIFKL